MSNPADNIFVCVIFFVLQGPLDGFPISRLSSDALSWPTEQPSFASSDSLWTFPTTPLQSSYKRDLISSTPMPSLPAAAVTCRLKRIRSSDDRNSIRTLERQSYSSSDKRDTRPAAVVTERSSQPASTSYNDVSEASSSRPSAGTRLRVSSPSSEKTLQKTLSMTTSYAMRLQSNFQLSKREEAPMIVFDQNGKMYTNVYPPIGHRGNDYNTRKSGDEDWVRKYLPKWLVIGGNKT